MDTANPEAIPGLPLGNNTYSKSFSIDKSSHYSSTRTPKRNLVATALVFVVL
jgi:hypothetical protein